MGIIEITKELQKQIDKIFKKESIEMLKHLNSLKKNPLKEKKIGRVEEFLIKV